MIDHLRRMVRLKMPHTHPNFWRYLRTVIRLLPAAWRIGSALLWSRIESMLTTKRDEAQQSLQSKSIQLYSPSEQVLHRLKMGTWVESFFYADPPQSRNAPESRLSSGRSRAIDVFLINNPAAPARISYSESGKLATPSQFEYAINNSLLDSTVNPLHMLLTWKALTATSRPLQRSCLWTASSELAFLAKSH